MEEHVRKFYKKPGVWIATVVSILLVLTAGWLLWAETAQAPGASENIEESETESNQDYVGLNESEAVELAEERDRPHRVVHRDGEDLPVTMDLRPERINFWVEDGVVFQALSDEEMGQERE